MHMCVHIYIYIYTCTHIYYIDLLFVCCLSDSVSDLGLRRDAALLDSRSSVYSSNYYSNNTNGNYYYSNNTNGNNTNSITISNNTNSNSTNTNTNTNLGLRPLTGRPPLP